MTGRLFEAALANLKNSSEEREKVCRNACKQKEDMIQFKISNISEGERLYAA